MEEKLVPAHILFARWFIRIRWVALGILLFSNYAVRHLFNVSIQEVSIYILSGALLLFNILHTIFLKQITKKASTRVILGIKKEIHFQIITDLAVLTIIIHYSGGIENPLILFYFLHMIIASSIFSTLVNYFYVAYTILLLSAMALLECYSVIPHYPMIGFADNDLYNNTLYVFGTGFVFTCTSIIVVSLSHMIISRSIKSEETYVKTNIELEKYKS